MGGCENVDDAVRGGTLRVRTVKNRAHGGRKATNGGGRGQWCRFEGRTAGKRVKKEGKAWHYNGAGERRYVK